MNPSFQTLAPARRNTLLAAGYRTFALCPYGKASMAAVAAEAGISKSLLFYYFRDKREFYLYLFDRALRRIARVSRDSAPERGVELFAWVDRVVTGRLTLLAQQPYLLRFATRAYYETDARVNADILARREAFGRLGIPPALERIDRTGLANPDDAEALLEIILCLAEGCMQGQETLAPDALAGAVARFRRMLQSLKAHYQPMTESGGIDHENHPSPL